MNDQIEKLVCEYQEEGDFTRVPPTSEMLVAVKEKLGVTLPEQYLEYLNAYSHGGIAGVEILGIGLTGRAIFLDETLEYRDEGLPENLVVIENCDEWLYCIDCSNGSVVSWEIDGDVEHVSDSFDEFLLSEYTDAVENL